jgi:hypothetical protein
MVQTTHDDVAVFHQGKELEAGRQLARRTPDDDVEGPLIGESAQHVVPELDHVDDDVRMCCAERRERAGEQSRNGGEVRAEADQRVRALPSRRDRLGASLDGLQHMTSQRDDDLA